MYFAGSLRDVCFNRPLSRLHSPSFFTALLRSTPVCVYREPDLIERTARDFLTDTVDNIICDDAETTEHTRSIAGKISRRAKRHIQHRCV